MIMTARSLYLLLTIALIISMAIAIGATVVAVALPILNESLLTTWSVYIDVTPTQVFSYPASNTTWTIEPSQGVLSVGTTAWELGVSRALNILVLWGVIVTIICYLRRVVGDVRSERPFNLNSAQYLKKAGYLLIALPIWLFLEVFIRFYVFMPDATDVAEFRFTHIQVLTEGDAGMSIYPDFNVGLLIAGVFVLVIARAFEIGIELQRDSDEII
ncbi:DUF2975 domain-containing protein [Kangiella sp. M94]